MLTHDASMDFAASKGKSMILNRISSAMVVPLLHESEKEVLGVALARLASRSRSSSRRTSSSSRRSPARRRCSSRTPSSRRRSSRRSSLRDRFSRLVAPNVAEQMIERQARGEEGRPARAGAHGLQQRHPRLHGDERGHAAPRAIVEMLNEYFELMVETLFKYEGTLDKFMGDGIMAFWGAPVVHRDDAVRCVQCALDQMEVLGRVQPRSASASGKPPLAVGIGIHTGPVRRRLRRAARRRSRTRSSATPRTPARGSARAPPPGRSSSARRRWRASGNRFEVEEIDAKSLKGKEKPMRRFNVLREKPSAVAQRRSQLTAVREMAQASGRHRSHRARLPVDGRRAVRPALREARRRARRAACASCASWRRADRAASSRSSAASRTRPASSRRELFAELSPWQKVQLSRHPNRPYTLDYLVAHLRRTSSSSTATAPSATTRPSSAGLARFRGRLGHGRRPPEGPRRQGQREAQLRDAPPRGLPQGRCASTSWRAASACPS